VLKLWSKAKCRVAHHRHGLEVGQERIERPASTTTAGDMSLAYM